MTETTRRDFMKLMVAAGAVVVMPIGATQAEADAKVVGKHRSLFNVEMLEIDRGEWKSPGAVDMEPDLHFDLRGQQSSIPFTSASLNVNYGILGGCSEPGRQGRSPIITNVDTMLSFEAVMTEDLNKMAWDRTPIKVRYTLEDGGFYAGTFVITSCSHNMDLVG